MSTCSAASSSCSWPSPISSRRSDAGARPRPRLPRLQRPARLGLLAALAAAALTWALAGSPPPARAADPPAAPPGRAPLSPADSAARAALPRTAPFKVMLRSAVVPGWGQMYNHQPLKAAAVVGGEGFLASRILHELKLQNDAVDRLGAAIAAGDRPESTAASLEADLHRNRKVTWIWWTVAAHLLQMADAYVDAHLSTFAADVDDDRRSSSRRRIEGGAAARPAWPPEPPDPTLSLAVRVRF